MLHLALLGTQNRINASFAVSATACRSMRRKVQKHIEKAVAKLRTALATASAKPHYVTALRKYNV